jgi:hypothetical protein
MPWWYFAEQTVIGSDGVAHRLDCLKAPEPDDGVMVDAGEMVTRRVAPSACWTCRPAMSMLLGHAGKGPKPRQID